MKISRQGIETSSHFFPISFIAIIAALAGAGVVIAAVTWNATVSTPYSISPTVTASVANANTGNGPCSTSVSGSSITIGCGPASVTTAGATFTIDISVSGATGTSGTIAPSSDTNCGGSTFTITGGSASITCTVTAASGGGTSNVILNFS